MHQNSVQGRILHKTSSAELIECFTETFGIGRPPKLPEWIISGAVIGMQSGTESVPHIWNELKMYNLLFQHFGYWRHVLA
ncbi:alpha-xylosidase 2 [Pyrus ussuriensis x Pyrus communis]|uniref:Alpha-xylosidase 2 n=1 Tax=Pyrus ussuriensis x Pyrus communis TaxID=2448454 RepID=A0A5N5H1X1_9ROSA|nr:alpha-xylosidase 2 [Pyrus ussuriensis x Pyrus communis]